MRQITSSDGPADDVMREPGRRRPRGFPFSRSGIAAIAAVSAVLAAGVAGAGYLSTGHQAASAGALGGAAGGRAGADSASPARLPQLAGTPQVAVMPRPTARAASTPHAPASHPAPSGSATAPSATAAAPGAPAAPATTAPVTSGSASCTHPQFETSAQFGMWNLAPYFVYNDMWNSSGYSVTQTLYACSYSDWYVVADMNNDNGDGAVKTYPDSHRDFDNDPEISSLHSVTSTFAETDPHTGIYEDAYDIWLNGVATSGSTEVMIWTNNFHQVPAGSVQGTATFGGRTYTVWKNGSYIAFVANTNFTSGTMNLLQFFDWIIAKGWIPASSTLGAVDYGVEIVSTDSEPATFTFSGFSVNAS